MGKKWPIIVAIGLGIIAVVLINYYLQGQKRIYEQQLISALGEAEPVLFANRDIKKGEVITDRMIEERNIPSRFIQPGAVYAKKAVVGKISVAKIYKGEQMLSTKLVEQASEEARATTSLVAAIPRGKRAITIEMEAKDAAGGMVQPGDHVDIMATFKLPQKGQRTAQVITATLFQDVRVLAVGEHIATPEDDLTSKIAKRGPPAAPRSRKGKVPVTFALGPMEAEVLLAAAQLGEIKLILRGEGEVVSAPLPPITPEQVLMKYLRLGEETYEEGIEEATVDIIRGDKVETITVPKQKN